MLFWSLSGNRFRFKRIQWLSKQSICNYYGYHVNYSFWKCEKKCSGKHLQKNVLHLYRKFHFPCFLGWIKIFWKTSSLTSAKYHRSRIPKITEIYTTFNVLKTKLWYLVILIDTLYELTIDMLPKYFNLIIT